MSNKTTIDDVLEYAEKLGISCEKWVSHGKMRIYPEVYMKDMKVYLQLAGEEDDIEGAAFKVFCSSNK